MAAGRNTVVPKRTPWNAPGPADRAGLLPPAPEGHGPGKKMSIGVTIASLALLATCILLVLVFMGIL